MYVVARFSLFSPLQEDKLPRTMAVVPAGRPSQGFQEPKVLPGLSCSLLAQSLARVELEGGLPIFNTEVQYSSEQKLLVCVAGFNTVVCLTHILQILSYCNDTVIAHVVH